MSYLYQYLRDHNDLGIPSEEALQLFLWLYCTTDILPSSLRDTRVDKELLIETFERLTLDGLISPVQNKEGDTSTALGGWKDVIDAFLSNRIELDFGFPERARRYL